MDGQRPPQLLRTAAIALAALAVIATTAPAASAVPVKLPGCGSAARTRALPAPVSDLAILCLINRHRATHHVAPLRISVRLAFGARRHSQEMIADHYFSHRGPGNSSPQSRVHATGYLRGARRWAIGEALAWVGAAQATPKALVDMLMASPPHRAILLGATYRDIGIGVGIGAPVAGMSGVTLTLDLGGVTR